MSEKANTVVRASDTELNAIFDRVKNWGRWGQDDERGTLNLLDGNKTRDAFTLASEGVTISLSRELRRQADVETFVPLQHFMYESGDALGHSTPGLQEAFDFLGIACHGYSITHIDALCHIFVKGQMYNGRRPDDVRSTGATFNGIGSIARTGIVGRAVLLDIPYVRGINYLDPGDAIHAAELDEAAGSLGFEVGAGDIVLVSTGRDARRLAEGPWDPRAEGLAGLHPDCIQWLRERDVAVLGGDGVQDPFPLNGAPEWPFPIHQCGIAGMGLTLIDNLDLSTVSSACRERNRFEMVFAAAPLRAAAATGSPVNPVVIL